MNCSAFKQLSFTCSMVIAFVSMSSNALFKTLLNILSNVSKIESVTEIEITVINSNCYITTTGEEN